MKFASGASVQLQLPSGEIFEVDERARVFAALDPGHFVGLLPYLFKDGAAVEFPERDFVDGRNRSIGRLSEREPGAKKAHNSYSNPHVCGN
jgi:hypothetical protein